ncbi:hypothetical protein [Bacillus sp. 2205SS5-2]|uniref:hypothetical protein n=1 Tax=Bacillus sp. 2205SS5-2 TaxID=3109031 RepID=UPI003003C692
MKNSEVMPASLERYSFDPEPQATVAGQKKAEVASQGRLTNARVPSHCSWIRLFLMEINCEMCG